ncbi:MAG: hypothetical protein HQK67_04990 [Desulfamplus sp.]|nr:hypothetical protein [Desulfamplus sp.]
MNNKLRFENNDLRFEDLSQRQISCISNVCGEKNEWIKPQHAIFFKYSCNVHDISYAQGGCEEDRKIADAEFLRSMLNDCQKISGILNRKRYRAWAYLYFAAIRALGWKYFNYRHEKLSLTQLATFRSNTHPSLL